MSGKFNEFESYNSAYVVDPKVRIDFDKFAEDLYLWKKDIHKYQVHQLEEYLDKKPQMEA